jgi:Tfp pilus assembly protein PilN
MIEINLLPEEMKKKESFFAKMDLSVFKLQKLPVLPIAAGFAGLLIAVQVTVFAVSIYAGISLGSLTKKYEAIALKRKEAEALKAKNDAIIKRAGAIDELTGKRFSWAKKLNALSDSVTQGIWLSELDYDERPAALARAVKGKAAGMPGRLVMNGYAAGIGEQGASLVGKFIKNLRENEAFYADFSDIDLVSVKSDKVEGQEVMSFKISCVFK